MRNSGVSLWRSLISGLRGGPRKQIPKQHHLDPRVEKTIGTSTSTFTNTEHLLHCLRIPQFNLLHSLHNRQIHCYDIQPSISFPISNPLRKAVCIYPEEQYITSIKRRESNRPSPFITILHHQSHFKPPPESSIYPEE